MTRQARILIVDDEAKIRSFIRRVLERNDIHCQEAGSVGEALEVLGEGELDLVLCDVEMPGRSGIDLLTVMSVSHPATPFVMVTGVDEPEVARAALDLGAYGYLIKPISPSQLVITVAGSLRRARLEVYRRRHKEILEQAVEQRTQDLRSSREETIHRLARAAEFRDDDTGQHITRIGMYSAVMARAMGLDSSRTEAIRIASTMHDVGKIAIPDTILKKPGELTDREFHVIKGHPRIGHRILAGSSSDLIELAASIALCHHEKFDGTGYPEGLRGAEIPLEGRICAVADVFDALTSDRVYKKAYTLEAALEIMGMGEGCHFDPEVLDLFMDHLDEIIEIRHGRSL